MPYVDQETRKRLIDSEFPKNAGELNYEFTRAIIEYMRGKCTLHQFRDHAHMIAVVYWFQNGPRYQHANDIAGAMICANKEARRRLGPSDKMSEIAKVLAATVDDFYSDIVAPYEDQKIKENGDVYGTGEQVHQVNPPPAPGLPS